MWCAVCYFSFIFFFIFLNHKNKLFLILLQKIQENLLFIEEIEQLHQINNYEADQVIKKVKHIQCIFFQGECILNLDSELLSNVKKKLNSGNEEDLNDIQLFDECGEFIKEIIKKDSLNKWKASPHFPKNLTINYLEIEEKV